MTGGASLRQPPPTPTTGRTVTNPPPPVVPTDVTPTESTPSVTVPDVINRTIDEATSALYALGLQVRPRSVESDEDAGIVVAQSPGASKTAVAGTTVVLSVSKGPDAPVLVPDVTSLDAATATSVLKAATFRVAVTRQATPDPSQDGIVLSQKPLAGSEKPPKTIVTILVGELAG